MSALVEVSKKGSGFAIRPRSVLASSAIERIERATSNLFFNFCSHVPAQLVKCNNL